MVQGHIPLCSALPSLLQLPEAEECCGPGNPEGQRAGIGKMMATRAAYIYTMGKVVTLHLSKLNYTALHSEAQLSQTASVILDTQANHKTQQWLSVLFSLSGVLS